jgi:hypothetical protein
MFWGVAADRNPVAATLLRNIILVAIFPPPSGVPCGACRRGSHRRATRRLRCSPECAEGKFRKLRAEEILGS